MLWSRCAQQPAVHLKLRAPDPARLIVANAQCKWQPCLFLHVQCMCYSRLNAVTTCRTIMRVLCPCLVTKSHLAKGLGSSGVMAGRDSCMHEQVSHAWYMPGMPSAASTCQGAISSIRSRAYRLSQNMACQAGMPASLEPSLNNPFCRSCVSVCLLTL